MSRLLWHYRRLKLRSRFWRFWHCLWNVNREVYGSIFRVRPGTWRIKGTIVLGGHRALTLWNDEEVVIMCTCGKEF